MSLFWCLLTEATVLFYLVTLYHLNLKPQTLPLKSNARLQRKAMRTQQRGGQKGLMVRNPVWLTSQGEGEGSGTEA